MQPVPDSGNGCFNSRQRAVFRLSAKSALRAPPDSSCVITQELVDFRQGELIELHDLGMGAISGRQYGSGLVFVLYVHKEPCFVNPVLATPVGMRQEMGATLEENLDGTRACHRFRLVWNFNQKSGHD